MTVELILTLYIEGKISEDECIKIKESIKSSEYSLVNDWITGRHFSKEMTRISKEFSHIKFHCIYYSDIDISKLYDEYWIDGKEIYCNEIKNEYLDALIGTVNYFRGKEENKEDEEKDRNDEIINRIENEIESLRKQYIKKYAKKCKYSSLIQDKFR